jgi:hypothetical protein
MLVSASARESAMWPPFEFPCLPAWYWRAGSFLRLVALSLAEAGEPGAGRRSRDRSGRGFQTATRAREIASEPQTSSSRFCACSLSLKPPEALCFLARARMEPSDHSKFSPDSLRSAPSRMYPPAGRL